MHIPDGFLTPPVWLTLDAISAPAIAWAARRRPDAESASGPRQIPLLGVMGAFVFAAQMVNFPVAFGASGHLLGGTLLAVVLGPSAAALTLSAIVVLQALLFQDGGVLALGANIFNMSFLGVLAGYLPVWFWGRSRMAVFSGGVLSVLTSGAFALWELKLSGVALGGSAVGIALALFCLTGILEGAITVAALRAIERLSPRALPEHRPVYQQTWAAVAMAALLLVTAGVWVASAAPDSIQHLAAQLGIEEQPVWTGAPFAGYALAGAGPEWLQKSIAGLAGIGCVFAISAIGSKRR